MKAVISSNASEFPLWCKWIWYLIIIKQLTTALKCTGRVHMHRGNFNTSTNRPIREIISVITKQMISTSLKFVPPKIKINGTAACAYQIQKTRPMQKTWGFTKCTTAIHCIHKGRSFLSFFREYQDLYLFDSCYLFLVW